MSRHQKRFDAKQIICTIIGGVFGVGLIFLIGIHVGKQVGGPDAIDFQAETTHQVPTGAVASASNQLEPDYRFFELLEAPAPQRELPEVELAINPVLEEREKKREEHFRKVRERRKKKREAEKHAKKHEKHETDDDSARKTSDKPVQTAEKPKKLSHKAQKAVDASPETQAKLEPTSAPRMARTDEEAAETAPKKTEKTPKAAEPGASPADAREKTAERSPQRYTVQVSAFPEEDAARKLAAKLAGKGYKARVTSEEVPGKGTWYRVRVGAYDTREAADAVQDEIESRADLAGFVIRL